MVLEDNSNNNASVLQLPQTPKFIVTVLGNEEGVFLLMRINPRKPMYLLNQAPCGKTENGESSIQAAHRETYEETALSIAHRRFKYVGNDPNYDCDIYWVHLQGHELPERTEPENMSSWIFYPWETYLQMARDGRLTPSLSKFKHQIVAKATPNRY